MRRLALAAALCAFAVPASAAVLYKTVDDKGVIMFSDMPPAQGVDAKRIQVPESSSAAPGSLRPMDNIVAGTPTVEERIRLGDEAVQRASTQVDLAEHALAVARRPLWDVADPMRLEGAKLTRADRERLDYYRKNLKVAQNQLSDVLRQQRKAEVQRTMTAENTGMPIYGPSSPIYRR
jgi:hypothetical protein